MGVTSSRGFLLKIDSLRKGNVCNILNIYRVLDFLSGETWYFPGDFVGRRNISLQFRTKGKGGY